MKIVQVINSLAGGGAEILAVNLSISLSEMSGNHVTLVTLYGEKDSKGIQMSKYLEERNVSYVPLHQGQFSKIGQLKKLHKLLRELNPDVVHSHLMPSDLWNGLCKLSPFTKFRLIRTIHNNRIDQYPTFFHKLLARIYDVNIACSYFVRDTYPINAIKKHLIAIPNGIQIPENYPLNYGGKQDLRTKLGLPVDKTILINIGSMFLRDGILYKNQGLIIESIPLLNEDIVVVLLGDGKEKENLERRAIELKVRDRVIFCGLVSDPLPYLAASDVFLMPSVNEGLPLSLLEALCTGLPSILSNIPAFQSFKKKSVTLLDSLTVDALAESVHEITNNIERYRKDASVNAIENQKIYNIKEVAIAYAKYYI